MKAIKEELGEDQDGEAESEDAIKDKLNKQSLSR
jgi:ATP-dependent Lon protease